MKSQPSFIDLSSLSCQHLRGVGQRIAERLARLGIQHVQDLLFHLPFRYQDRTRVHCIGDIMPGNHVVIEGEMVAVSTPKGGRTKLLCRLEDRTGRVHLRFFYLNSLQIKALQVGVRLRCFGEVRRGMYGLEMIHPEYRPAEQETVVAIEQNLTPIYPTTEGLSQITWRKLMTQALQLLDKDSLLQDILPSPILKKLRFPTLSEALHFVHRPPVGTSIDLLLERQHHSQKRLVFEELLAHRLSLLSVKNLFQVQQAISLSRSQVLERKFLESLPFQLTTAQKKVIEEIHQDLCLARPMLRLVQGDVGSGKTVVAALSVLQAIEHGCQAAILAPTELLVEQHYHTFQRWFEPLGIKVVVLSRQIKATLRQEVLLDIATGKAQVIIGTHAILQKNIEFSKLALIVVDEQHRFGVQQRALLREKGIYKNNYPHQLIMTATPIPRTLAMSMYADLDCSVIDELPPGRIPVLTRVISNDRRDEILTRIHEACILGRQAYWVCTLIEESDMLQCQAAENTAMVLSAALPELKIALLHGRMKAVDKVKVMHSFKEGDVHLLVSTTVIEVGVDVPRASLMVIENAERLGLAQLHQLRGRVGRGAIESHCLLLYQPPLARFAKERLAVMRETTDGFKIAQCDLELRGPGEVLGTKQTGDISLRIADLMRDSDLFPAVQAAANIFLKEYPERIPLLIKRWLRDNTRYGQV
ncbi:MAG: recG [Gammaproteobacteria bacterium]|jgi:ATP-dependent DNA helicase RecG|nr:recG [Gammaproteobacteria bacterium]